MSLLPHKKPVARDSTVGLCLSRFSSQAVHLSQKEIIALTRRGNTTADCRLPQLTILNKEPSLHRIAIHRINYRVPDSGRKIAEVWTNVPPRVAKFQVGATYRLPLWELVYHDCLCAHWYWGDYNNKLPSLWDKRDLFNVLYGTMGMYLFNAKQWEADKDRFVRSYRVTSPVARKTGYSEMLDHRILSADRLVQRTTFADGTVVTVNFGETPFALPEGGTLAAGGYLVR